MMKKLLLQSALFSFLFITGISALQAQSFKVIAPKLFVFNKVYKDTTQGHNFQYINISGADLKLDWYQFFRPADVSSWNYQMCDNAACYAGSAMPTPGNSRTTAATPKTDTSAFLGDWTPTANTSANDTFKYLIFEHGNFTNRDTLIVVFSPVTTGIEKMNYGTIQLETSPNPVTNTLRITSKNLRAGTVEIYNLAGQKLQAITVGESQYTTLNTETLNPGMYILRYTDKNGDFGLRKFIKE